MIRKTLRKRGRTSRKDEVLRVAAHLFKEHGYHGTSMRQLADALGLEKGSLYHHLSSKEDLVYEIMITGLTVATSRLNEIADNPFLTPTQQLRRVVRALVDDICEDFEASVALAVITDGRVLSPKLRSKYVQARDAYEDKLESILQAGISANEIAPCNTNLIAKAIVGMCGWMCLWYRPDGPLKPEAIADAYARLVLEGLAARQNGAPAADKLDRDPAAAGESSPAAGA